MFQSLFTDYNFPKLGFVRVPRFEVSKALQDSLNVTADVSTDVLLEKMTWNYFEDKIAKGIIPEARRADYVERLNFELSEIKKLMFSDYILLVFKIIDFCKANDILNGPSRGSAGGSLLLFILDVVKIDAIKHDLLFERFISAIRTEVKEIDGVNYISSETLPDVDIDSDHALKYKVNEFLAAEYPDRTASMLTVNTLQGKMIMKESVKVCEGATEDEAKKVADLIEAKFGKVQEIGEALASNEKFAAWAKDHELSVRVARKLNGLVKNTSVHASGIIICETPVQDLMPVRVMEDGRRVCGFTMNYAQLLGIKVDNLGVKNLGAIKICLELVGKKFSDVDVNDPSIYNFLNNSSDYYGIWQAEEGLGKDVLKKIKPQNINDIALSIAVGRPGSMKFIPDVIKGKNEGELMEIDPRVSHILGSSYNVLVFQEQIMALCRDMAKFSGYDTNQIRKHCAKKAKEKLGPYKDKFIQASIANGFSPEFSAKIWQSFEDSGDYSFNLSHSVGYAYLTAITAYCKANHPKEYFLALLRMAKHSQKPIDEISRIQRELPRFGVQLLSPHIVKSGMDFSIEGNDIRFGLLSIKGISEKSIEKLNGFRKEHSNKFEIFKGAADAGLPIGILCALIQAGALEGYGTSRTKLVYEAQVWNILTENEQKHALLVGEKCNYDMVETVTFLTKMTNEKGRPIIPSEPEKGTVPEGELKKIYRLNTIKKHSQAFKAIYQQNTKNLDFANWFYERSLLGYSCGKTLHSIFAEHDPELVSLSEAMNQVEGAKVRFIANVTEVFVGTSKKGTKYVKFKVADETEESSVMLFDMVPKHKREGSLSPVEKTKVTNGGKLPSEESIIIVEGTKKEGCFFGDLVSVQDNKIFMKLKDLGMKRVDSKLKKSDT